jgi:hypothetical protein
VLFGVERLCVLERALTAQDMYLMSDYLPLAVVIPGWIFYSLLVVAAVAIVVCFFGRFYSRIG